MSSYLTFEELENFIYKNIFCGKQTNMLEMYNIEKHISNPELQQYIINQRIINEFKILKKEIDCINLQM